MSAQDPFASRGSPPPPAEPADVTLADDRSGANGDSFSFADDALRRMKDTRTTQIPDSPDQPKKIQLFSDDDDFF